MFYDIDSTDVLNEKYLYKKWFEHYGTIGAADPRIKTTIAKLKIASKLKIEGHFGATEDINDVFLHFVCDALLAADPEKGFNTARFEKATTDLLKKIGLAIEQWNLFVQANNPGDRKITANAVIQFIKNYLEDSKKDLNAEFNLACSNNRYVTPLSHPYDIKQNIVSTIERQGSIDTTSAFSTLNQQPGLNEYVLRATTRTNHIHTEIFGIDNQGHKVYYCGLGGQVPTLGQWYCNDGDENLLHSTSFIAADCIRHESLIMTGFEKLQDKLAKNNLIHRQLKDHYLRVAFITWQYKKKKTDKIDMASGSQCLNYIEWLDCQGYDLFGAFARYYANLCQLPITSDLPKSWQELRNCKNIKAVAIKFNQDILISPGLHKINLPRTFCVTPVSYLGLKCSRDDADWGLSCSKTAIAAAIAADIARPSCSVMYGPFDAQSDISTHIKTSIEEKYRSSTFYKKFDFSNRSDISNKQLLLEICTDLRKYAAAKLTSHQIDSLGRLFNLAFSGAKGRLVYLESNNGLAPDVLTTMSNDDIIGRLNALARCPELKGKLNTTTEIQLLIQLILGKIIQAESHFTFKHSRV